MARYNFQVGDIIKSGELYCKITKIDNTSSGRQRYWGYWVHSLEKAITNKCGFNPHIDSHLESSVQLVKKKNPLDLSPMERLKQLSRREQIIFLANKYKEDILKKRFLTNNIDYSRIANDFGISTEELYKYFSFKLMINRLSHKLNEWKYVGFDNSPKKEEKIEERKNVFKNEAIFSVIDVWKLLAYYCKYYSIKEAKGALSRFERLFAKKDWGRIKEMWTPLFYPDYDYLQSKMVVCKILKRRESKLMVYDAELLDDGMTGKIDKEQYLNRKCIVIAKEKNKERIDYLMKQGSIVKVIGRKEKPFRNKTSEILKITTTRKK